MERDFLHARDMEYCKGWLQHNDQYEDWNVYLEAAEMLQPTRGIHVDLGSGIGGLMYRLKEQNPALTVIGVDNNQIMAAAASKILQNSNIPVLEVSQVEEKKMTDGKIVRGYKKIKKIKSRNVLKRGQVSIICDDIRKMTVVREILGGEKVDSASFMFPGGSIRMSLEEQNQMDFHEEHLFERQKEIMETIRRSAGTFVSKNVKQGGKVLLVERVGVYSIEKPEDIPTFIAERIFADEQKNWQLMDRKNLVIGGHYAPMKGVTGQISHSFNVNSGVELTTSQEIPPNTQMVINMSTWKKT
jgi:hypothetical protein